MLFDRQWRIKSNKNSEEIKNHLLGKQFRIHKLDFEVMELGGMLKLIPHAENVESIKTLPITHLKLEPNKNTNQTDIVFSSKPRKIDLGVPYLVLSFVAFLVIFSIFYYTVFYENGFVIPLTLLLAAFIIFSIFWWKMNVGYFDYIKKIKKATALELQF